MKDKLLRGIIFGDKTNLIRGLNNRTQFFTVPPLTDDETSITITYPTSEGFCITLWKKYLKLQKRVEELEGRAVITNMVSGMFEPPMDYPDVKKKPGRPKGSKNKK